MATTDNKSAKGTEIEGLLTLVATEMRKGAIPETVASAFCDLAYRVQALESIVSEDNLGTRTADEIDAASLKVGGVDVKTKQTAKSSPSASRTEIAFIDTLSQDTNGVVTATKKNVRTATASQTGVTKVYTSTGDSTDGTMTRKAISEAIAAKQPERLVVTPTESGGVYSNDFATISAAVTAGKDVWLRISSPYDNSSYFHYVPLSEAVFKNNAYTKFIFARPRSYETDAEGIIDTWTCTSSSPYWVYASKYVYYAATAGVAASAGTANTATNADITRTPDVVNGDKIQIGSGNAVNIVYTLYSKNAGSAGQATNDDDGNEIRGTYQKKAVVAEVGPLNRTTDAYVGSVVVVAWRAANTKSNVSDLINDCTETKYHGNEGRVYAVFNMAASARVLRGLMGGYSDIQIDAGKVLYVLRFENNYWPAT